MNELRGKKALVLGLNQEGYEVLKALAGLGAKAIGYGNITDGEWGNRTSQEPLPRSVQIFESDEPPPEALQVNVVVVASRQKAYLPILEALKSKGVQFYTPIQFVLQFSKVPIIAVTGTNGKSSVAKLTELMLSKSGKSVLLAGGSFQPYSRLLTSKMKFDMAVFEVNSTTLAAETDFKPQVAIVTNIVPSHFERHDSFQEYLRAKGKIFAKQTAEDLVVYNAENPYVVDMVKAAKSRRFPVYNAHLQEGVESSPAGQCYYKKQAVYYCLPGKEPEIYSTLSWQVKGRHFISNVLCALSAARAMGADYDSIVAALDQFEGLPHRMKKCLEKDGLTFYDDSRSSNPAWRLLSESTSSCSLSPEREEEGCSFTSRT
ncbi:MAG: hypothetical protein K8R69_04730 [Deltaproteobacteria bacterium]|nr:hypothetical protein [Deltaproteobacteria bacterium]